MASQLALSAALYLLTLALLPHTEKVRCRRRAISIIISYTVTIARRKSRVRFPGTTFCRL